MQRQNSQELSVEILGKIPAEPAKWSDYINKVYDISWYICSEFLFYRLITYKWQYATVTHF